MRRRDAVRKARRLSAFWDYYFDVVKVGRSYRVFLEANEDCEIVCTFLGGEQIF